VLVITISGPHLDLPANSLPKSLALADVNGDGRPDIVITNTTYPSCCTYEGSTISVFLNLADGKFSSRQDFEAGGNPFSLLVRDLNGDGKADATTANYFDQTGIQHRYLAITHAVGLSGRPARLVGLLLIGAIGLAIALLGWRRYRWTGFLCAVVLTAVLAGWFYKLSKVRWDEGESHISILFGQ